MGEAAAATINKLGLTAVGFDSGHLTVAEFEALSDLTKSVEWKPGPDRVERQRMVKDSAEIEQIRHAIRCAEKAFVMFRAMLRAGGHRKRT